MKRVALLIMVLLSLQFISAIEFDMKESFDQGETLMAKISGNFLKPIQEQNIYFYRGHVRVPMNYDLAKINEDYYIYAPLLEKTPNEYSIIIKEVQYMVGAQISEEDITKNFNITENFADFSISPGFIMAEDSFSITVQNLNPSPLDIQINVQAISESGVDGFFASLFGNASEGGDYTISLKSGEIEKINFKANDITSTLLKTIKFSAGNTVYDIPIYLIPTNVTEIQISEENLTSFRLEPSELNISFVIGSTKIGIMHLYNTGEQTLENISLSVSESLEPYVSLSPEKIDELKINSSVKIELFIESLDQEGVLFGEIKASVVNGSGIIHRYSEIILNSIADYIPLDEINDSSEDTDFEITKTCAEFGGQICASGKECSGQTIHARDDVCCMGTCDEVKQSSVGKIIGWSMILVIVGFVLWFFKTKYRTARKEINLFKIAKTKKLRRNSLP